MIKDSLLYFLSKLFPAIINFFVLFLFLNFMNPDQYGLYSLIIVSIGLVNILFNQWIRSSYLRFNNTVNNGDSVFFSKQVFLIIILNLVTILTFLVVELNIYIKVFSIVILNFTVINEYLINYFRIYLMPKKVLFGNLMKNFTFFLSLLVINIVTDLNLYNILIAYSLGLILASIFFLKYFNFKVKFTPSKILLRKSLTYGLPISLSFAIGVLLQNIDKYMITYILDLESTGIYSLNFDLIHNFFYMIMSSLAMASLPRIIKDMNTIKSSSVEFQSYVNMFIYISIPIFITLIVISSDIASIFSFFGYDTTGTLIIFIILATFAHGIKSFIYDQALQLYENTTYIFIPTLLAIAINVIINLVLMKEYGVIIAAISSFVAFSVSAFLTYLMVRKDIKIKYDLHYFIIVGLLCILLLLGLQFIRIDNYYFNLLIKATITFTSVSLISFYYYKRRRFKVNENR